MKLMFKKQRIRGKVLGIYLVSCFRPLDTRLRTRKHHKCVTKSGTSTVELLMLLTTGAPSTAELVQYHV